VVFFLVAVVLGFELRPVHLLGRWSTSKPRVAVLTHSSGALTAFFGG
jgi:hypothetical protein